MASNGDNTVSWYRNVGNGSWEYHEIYTDAIFVLSVTTGDFDRDGDLDVASASFHDGAIRWYENLGDARSWKAHDLRVVKGTQGHYVHAADLDGDGDDDLGRGDATPGVRGRRRRGRALPCLIMLVF